MNHALIIDGCKKGNRLSQKQLFEGYSKAMMHVCRRYVANEHDAEELLLSGFCKFFSTISRFNYIDDNSLGGWLKQIMINECLMFLRKQNKIILAEEHEYADVIIDEEMVNNLSAKNIIALVNTIPEGYRLVFNLYIMEGYNHNEIATLLGISAGTSKSQLMRAKMHLQKLLIEKGVVYATR